MEKVLNHLQTSSDELRNNPAIFLSRVSASDRYANKASGKTAHSLYKNKNAVLVTASYWRRAPRKKKPKSSLTIPIQEEQTLSWDHSLNMNTTKVRIWCIRRAGVKVYVFFFFFKPAQQRLQLWLVALYQWRTIMISPPSSWWWIYPAKVHPTRNCHRPTRPPKSLQIYK